METLSHASLQTERLVFLDKIRYSVVLLVVVLHAACAYTNIIPWWSVLDAERSTLLDLFIILLDMFVMPVLYFIAGYFALPSLRKHGAGGFAIRKLKRLGLPLLLLGIFLVPVVGYIGYHGRTPDPTGFFTYWWRQMPSAFSLQWVHFVNPQVAARHMNDFAIWHLWFISLLLIFFLLTALVYRWLWRPHWQERQPPSPTNYAVMRVLVTTAAGIGLSVALVNRYCPDWSWAKWGGFIMFQPTRVPVYAGLFIFGIYTFARRWFTASSLPGSPWLWLAACGVLSLALLVVAKAMLTIPAPIPWSRALSQGLLRALLCLAYIGLLTTLGWRFSRRPNAFWRNLYPVSYDIYLIHLPIVVGLQWMVAALPVSIYLKFTLVAAAGVALSWGLGRALMTPRPKTALGVLVTIFAVTAALV